MLSTLTVIVIIGIAALLTLGVLLVRKGGTYSKRDAAGAAEESVRSGGGVRGAANSGAAGKMSGKVAAAASAYERGDIDTETLSKAAKAVGISAEEAEKRLQAAGSNAPRRANISSKSRDAKRKKNKQARSSRKGNRR
jgi:hypothetical protein